MATPKLATLLETLATAESPETKARTAIEIARLLIDEGDYAQAERYAQDALKVALPAQLGEAYYQKARALFMQEELNSTKEAVGEAIACFEQNGQMHEVGKCHNLLGALYTNVHNFASALENFEKAIEINEQTENTEQLGRVFANLLIFVRLAMPAKNILVFYQNLLVEASQARQGFVHHNLGIFHRQEQQDKLALPAFEQAHTLLQPLDLQYGLSETIYQLASLYDLEGEAEKAYSFYLSALEQSLKEEKPERVELILYYFSHALEEVKDATLRQKTEALVAEAESRGFKVLPTEGHEAGESALPTEIDEQTPIETDFAEKLAEVARLERNLSAEELAKQYAETQDMELGLIWLKKLLNQYNNAWFNRKSKLKAYEDAKASILQNIDAQINSRSL